MNLNENATQFDVFITTSVLLAGNSIDKKYFDKCYVFIADKTDNPKSIHQMIKRVRNLKGCEIVSHVTYHEHLDHKYDLVDIRQWMKSAREYMKRPTDWFNCFDYNENGILEHKSNIYFDLLCRYKQQQMNKQHCFVSWYIGLCHENKYIVSIIDKIPEDTTFKNEHKDNKKKVNKEHYEGIVYVDLPTEKEYEALKLHSETVEDQYEKEKFILAANYQLLDKPEAHAETIDNIEFVFDYFSIKKRQQHEFLRRMAYDRHTFDKFIEYTNTLTTTEAILDDNKKNYDDVEKFQRLVNGLNDIVKLIGYINFGDVDGKIIDGKTLKTHFDKNKTELLKLYSIFHYQIKLDKNDFSKFDLGKFIQSFNYILEDLLNGRFENVSESKSHDINYKKYQFNHGFITNKFITVHEAITINFMPFDENSYNKSNSCYLLDEEEPDFFLN